MTGSAEVDSNRLANGSLSKLKQPFAESTLADVAGCLPYRGQPKRLEDFEKAIQQGLAEQWPTRS